MRYLTQLNYVNVVAKTGSIRRAADQLNITSTALNRRILALEDELGYPIFERLPQGVRLNIAGELLIQHIRASMADLSKVMSQIADLSGVRRGHITIAGGSEIVGTLLPPRIAAYRASHSQVTFEILRRPPEEALRALRDYSCDLSLVFGHVPMAEHHLLATLALEIKLAMRPSHPLAQKEKIQLADCQDYPVILPSHASGMYELIKMATAKKGIKLRQAITSESYEFMANYCRHEDAVSFLLPLSEAPTNVLGSDIVMRSFAPSETMTGLLHIVQAKGRVLPVAAAKFAEELVQYLNRSFPDKMT